MLPTLERLTSSSYRKTTSSDSATVNDSEDAAPSRRSRLSRRGWRFATNSSSTTRPRGASPWYLTDDTSTPADGRTRTGGTKTSESAWQKLANHRPRAAKVLRPIGDLKEVAPSMPR